MEIYCFYNRNLLYTYFHVQISSVRRKKYTYVVRGYNKYSRKLGPYDKRGRTVTVPLRVSQIKLNRSSLTFSKKGSIYRLTATVLPGNATNKSVTWKSSNPKAATVNSSGKVTAVSNGFAVITAYARDGSGKKLPVKLPSVSSRKLPEWLLRFSVW